jgi:hypothetical protein
LGVIVGDLCQYKVVYTASPYSLYPAGRVAAFRDICTVSAKLIKSGVSVYAPIVMTHPIAIHGDLMGFHNDPDSFDWIKFDEAMMNVSDALLVAKMLTWEVSVGIKYEINFFRKAGKPIYYLNPHTMEVSQTEDGS